MIFGIRYYLTGGRLRHALRTSTRRGIHAQPGNRPPHLFPHDGDLRVFVRRSKTADYRNIITAFASRKSSCIAHTRRSGERPVSRRRGRGRSVGAIKKTSYRTSKNLPVVSVLVDAGGLSNQMIVLVKGTTRIDDTNDIEWTCIPEES